MTEVFQNGREGSKSAFVEALTELVTQGNDIITTLIKARLESLVEFNRRLESVIGRRTLSNRVISAEQAVKFVVSDFSDIDQANTTATVRADSAVVSLRERVIPKEAVILSNQFSSNQGTLESLNDSQTIVTVHADTDSIPTGQFDITLANALKLNQIVIDIVPTPSTPTILINVSGDGLTYIPASNFALNGSRITVWLPSTDTKYIRVKLTPALPDNLSGREFTFGITNFYAQASTFQLRSDFLTKPLQFAPKSATVVFEAADDPNIQYYIAVAPAGQSIGAFVEINPEDAIAIGIEVTQTFTTNASTPTLITTAPNNLYLSSLTITEHGVAARIAPGLSPTDPRVSNLRNEYIVIVPTSIGYNISLLNSQGIYNPPRTFVVSYVYGPPLVDVQLKVRLLTDDSSTSPVFQGASLDEY